MGLGHLTGFFGYMGTRQSDWAGAGSSDWVSEWFPSAASHDSVIGFKETGV